MSLGVPQFPAQGSAQVAGTRNKVALKPGRSLMDWIRRSKSGEDLTGVGGRIQNVTPTELAKHNKPTDAWIALKGKVYNVSAYMDFHPGGEDELLRGVGRDATQLFDEVHRWVNYESMLASCLVGKLVTISPSKSGPTSSRNAKLSSSPNKLTPNGFAVPKVPVKMSPQSNSKPRYEWYQTDDSITLIVYTKCSHVTPDHVTVDKDERKLRVTVNIEENVCTLHKDLENDISDYYKILVPGTSGKVEIILQKRKKECLWNSSGLSLDDDHTMLKLKATDIEPTYRDCKIETVNKVTHDTKLYKVRLPGGTRLGVPVGHHVRLKASIEGMDIVRSYTVVLPSLTEDTQDRTSVYLMVKLYPDGAFTSYLNQLDIGDTLHVSNSEGSFTESQLPGLSHLILFAAGTGFTPMVRLINATCCKLKQGPRVKLVFFNKTEQDIMWRDQLEQLATTCDRLEVVHVLSSADESWMGPKGRVRQQLIDNHVPRPSDDKKVLFCACGPTPFTKEAIRLVTEFGYTESMTHAFLG